MLLVILATTASAQTYFDIGGANGDDNLVLALETAVAAWAEAPFLEPAVFQYVDSDVVEVYPIALDIPALDFDAVIDGQGRGIRLPRLIFNSDFVLRDIHLADDGEAGITVAGTLLTLENVTADGNTDSAVVASNNAVVTVVGGLYTGQRQAFVLTETDLVVTPGPNGSTSIAENDGAGLNGAGIRAVGGSVIFEGHLSGNEAANGGGIWMEGGGSVTILPGSELEWNNAVVNGGAVGIRESALDVQGGSFTSNGADAKGGRSTSIVRPASRPSPTSSPRATLT